jgi:hypothetical protein
MRPTKSSLHLTCAMHTHTPFILSIKLYNFFTHFYVAFMGKKLLLVFYLACQNSSGIYEDLMCVGIVIVVGVSMELPRAVSK